MLPRPFGAHLRQNVHYTFSGFNFMPTSLDLLLEIGVDGMMFSMDHPNASMLEGRLFLDYFPVSPLDKERIVHSNALRPFKFRASFFFTLKQFLVGFDNGQTLISRGCEIVLIPIRIADSCIPSPRSFFRLVREFDTGFLQPFTRSSKITRQDDDNS
jgi:hypothetical protein